MHEMAKGMTSRDLLGWRAYFHAAQELAAEAAGLVTAPAEPSGPALSTSPRLMTEGEMDAFFMAHARLHRAGSS